jgi:NADPH:quinone reductase
MSTMLEAVIHPLPTITSTIHSIPIPDPGPHELLIKVIAAGSNVKDWWHLAQKNYSLNSGDDIAGTVHAIGSSVYGFNIGDRVAAFHPMGTSGGAYAEYAIAPCHTTFHIPKYVSFEEASTIPLVSTTAAITLFRRQALPTPWSPAPPSSPPIPLIVYGASSALGLFTVKLARLANIHPIIAIGGASHLHLLPLLDKSLGDTFVDYCDGVESMMAQVASALQNSPFGPLKARHALDAISSGDTWVHVSRMLDPTPDPVTGQKSTLSVTSGANKYDEPEIPDGVKIVYTFVGTAHTGKYMPAMPKQPEDAAEVTNDIEFTGTFFEWVGEALAEGIFEGHRYKVTPGGLLGVEISLRALKEGKAKGKKFVCLVEETPGLEGNKRDNA